MTTTKSRTGFRHLPWRLSLKIFVLTFLFFLAVNYAIVRYTSRQPLFTKQNNSLDSSIKSIQTVLAAENQDLQSLRARIGEIRVTSASQRQAIQQVGQDLDAAGAKLHRASIKTARLLGSVDQVSRAASDQEQTLDKIVNELADVNARLQQVTSTLAQFGPKP
jgi:peptidoglycan hydrolase CwlO-like protein